MASRNLFFVSLYFAKTCLICEEKFLGFSIAAAHVVVVVIVVVVVVDADGLLQRGP